MCLRMVNDYEDNDWAISFCHFFFPLTAVTACSTRERLAHGVTDNVDYLKKDIKVIVWERVIKALAFQKKKN